MNPGYNGIMKPINMVEEVLHKIRVRLRPSRLPGASGLYTARVFSEAALKIEEVCASLKLRGGFTGSYEDAVKIMKQVLAEIAYQLCNGFSVNLGYFSIHPSVGGFFKSPNDEPDKKSHPVRFRFRVRKPMRDLYKHINIEVMLPDPGGGIDTFVDFESASENKTATPGGLFILIGERIKIRGASPDCGLYFVSADNPGIRIKATGSFPVNSGGRLSGKVPALPAGVYTPQIVTQHTTGNIDLKEPRIVTGDFTLRVL